MMRSAHEHAGPEIIVLMGHALHCCTNAYMHATAPHECLQPYSQFTLSRTIYAFQHAHVRVIT